MKIIKSKVLREKFNTLYEEEVDIDSLNDFKKSVSVDHVMCKFIDNKRSNTNFISCDCLYADIDNTHSENPKDWVTIKEFKKMFLKFNYYLATSSNHQKIKEGAPARDKYHVYFPINEINDLEKLMYWLKVLTSKYTFFDKQVKDAGRFFFGNPNSIVYHNNGKSILTDLHGYKLPAEVKEKIDFKPSRGNRDDQLFKAACSFHSNGMTDEEVLETVNTLNQSLTEPLDDRDIIKVVKSACKYNVVKQVSNNQIANNLLNGQPLTDYIMLELGGQILYANKNDREMWLNKYHLLQKTNKTSMDYQNWRNKGVEYANGVTCDFTNTDVIVDKKLNMFMGFPITENKGEIPTNWLKLVKEVICSNNNEYFTYLLDWISDMFQNPQESTAVVPVIISEQGAGKGLFYSAIKKIMGIYSGEVGTFEQVLGDFNGILNKKLLINMDEATFGKSKKEQGRLKYLTGTNQITINEKYKPSYTIPFSCRFLITSNFSTPVGVERDNRRFFVLEASNDKIDKKEYYEKVISEISSDEKMSSLLYFLKNRKISDTYNRKYVIHTIHEEDMKKEIQDSVGVWLDEINEDLVEPFENYKTFVKDDKIGLKDLYKTYSQWYENHRNTLAFREQVGALKLNKILKDTYWKDKTYKVVKIDNKTYKLWLLK
ncbi:MAG: hypothetical protein B6229_00430 [Spirochaetaceae bacterium 4572_7]|nr:MAG: hypothetical protein B6229_00430 [Spirochaetaceae bacterium 4572_7]